jgi:hypothetical protein
MNIDPEVFAQAASAASLPSLPSVQEFTGSVLIDYFS